MFTARSSVILTAWRRTPPAHHRYSLDLTSTGVDLQPITNSFPCPLVHTRVLQAALVKIRRWNFAVAPCEHAAAINNESTQPHGLRFHVNVQTLGQVKTVPGVQTFDLIDADAIRRLHRARDVRCQASFHQSTARTGVPTAHLTESVPFCPHHAPFTYRYGDSGDWHSLAQATC